MLAAMTSHSEPCSSDLASMEQVPEEVAELAIKYSFPWSKKCFQKDISDLHRIIKAELVKQMKLKEGCLRIQKLSKDRKQLEQTKHEIRDLCDSISDMQNDMNIIQMYMTGNVREANENVQSPNGEEEEHQTGPQESSRRQALEKELQKELNVKEGFEKFFSCELNPRAYNHKLMEGTRQLYDDNKAKITYLKMQIDRLVIQEQTTNGENFQSKSDAVIDDLLYRLHRETALTDGALNMLRTMKDSKKSEKNYKELHDAVIQAEEKIDLIRLALKKYMDHLPNESPKRVLIKKEIDPRSSDSRFSPPASYGNNSYGGVDSTPRASTMPRHSLDHRRSGAPMPTLAVSGKLDLRIFGCQDLISDISGRTHRGEYASISGGNSYSDLGKFKTTKNMQRQYSLRPYMFNPFTSRSNSISNSIRPIDGENVSVF
jgi:hypothetical protein